MAIDFRDVDASTRHRNRLDHASQSRTDSRGAVVGFVGKTCRRWDPRHLRVFLGARDVLYKAMDLVRSPAVGLFDLIGLIAGSLLMKQ